MGSIGRWRRSSVVALTAALLACLPACTAAPEGVPDGRSPGPSAASVVLFDGTTTTGWAQAGPGHFEIHDGALRTYGGMGLLWYTDRVFHDFVLELDWRVSASTDNSGVFVRFPDPGDDPWAAVHGGYEVQINDDPAGDPQKTGAVYGLQPPRASASRAVGAWNTYRIRVRGPEYVVWLNGVLVNRFVGLDPDRGTGGRIGLQNHDPGSRVEFRAIRIESL